MSQFANRAEWETYRAERQARTGEWGFDPGMPWHVADWRERIGIVLFWFFMWGVVFPALFVGAIWLLGAMIDAAQYRTDEHNRCLKQATNGYEIKQCR